ncbi:MAG TPA: MFS transporter [Verrucomicrobiae bacterium]|nr:MFS transporter [Verrucomicrobiae bacterium]
MSSVDEVGATATVPTATMDTPKHWMYLGMLILGYIGIYLCRKNFSVAVPMIQKAFGINKAQTGLIASVSTISYMVGKVIFGPIIDRVGGRVCFLVNLAGVGLFAILGGAAGSLALLTTFYTCNRFFGSGAWGSMIKQTPDWLSPRHLPLALAFLSMSYAVGGFCALTFAGWIADWSGNNWRTVMALPGVVMFAILLLCWIIVPRHAGTSSKNSPANFPADNTRSPFQKIVEVAKVPQFWVVCGLSFALTITRDFFNDWSVDFFKTAGGAATSVHAAANLSTSFDAVGAVGILFLGAVLQKLGYRARTWLLVAMMLLLSCMIYSLPVLQDQPLWMASAVVGIIGFLSYGPYSLLAGILSVEIKGKGYVATVAGFVDASGYLAGALAGYPFGIILDKGGYHAGFHLLAFTSLAAAVLCLFLYRKKRDDLAPVTYA